MMARVQSGGRLGGAERAPGMMMGSWLLPKCEACE